MSSEAWKLFFGSNSIKQQYKTYSREMLLMHIIYNIIMTHSTTYGYKDTINGCNKDNLCGTHDVLIIRQKAMRLIISYCLVLDNMTKCT